MAPSIISLLPSAGFVSGEVQRNSIIGLETQLYSYTRFKIPSIQETNEMCLFEPRGESQSGVSCPTIKGGPIAANTVEQLGPVPSALETPMPTKTPTSSLSGSCTIRYLVPHPLIVFPPQRLSYSPCEFGPDAEPGPHDGSLRMVRRRFLLPQGHPEPPSFLRRSSR